MRTWITPAVVTLMLAGCSTHTVLRDNTLQTAATLADLNCQQVLDNVARFSVLPSGLPSVAVVNNGTVTVTDQSSLGGAATYAPTMSFAQQIGGFPILSLFLAPSVQHNLAENWTMVPVTEPNKVRRVRCAFQLLFRGGSSTIDCDDCLKKVAEVVPTDAEHLNCSIPVGWFTLGCKKDVPTDACFVGNYRDTYVWVTASGIDGLSRFTMTVMELISTEPEAATKTVLRKFDADGKLQGSEITTKEPDPESQVKAKKVTEAEPSPESSPTSESNLLSQPRSPKQTALSPKQAHKRVGTSVGLFPQIQ